MSSAAISSIDEAFLRCGDEARTAPSTASSGTSFLEETVCSISSRNSLRFCGLFSMLRRNRGPTMS